VQHGIAVAKDANSGLQAVSKVAMRNPVGHTMVGVPGYKHTHIDAAPDSRLQRFKEHPVGHEVGSREEDELLCLINRSDVEIANGERQAHSLILTDGDTRVNAAVMPLRYPLVCRAEAIPESSEGSGEFRRHRATQAQVRIAPLRRVDRAEIVASDKARLAVDDEQFAVVQCEATRIKQMPRTAESAVFKHMHRRDKRRFEGSWNHEIAKTIKDDIDRHTLCRLPSQVRLKFLANSIIFPDVGFYINTLLCRIDCLQHRIIQITPVGKELEDILANLHFLEGCMGKAHLVFAAFS
jgi:hypothetical protein